MSRSVDTRSEPTAGAAVLLIDEDLGQLERVGRILQGIGYNVQACNSYAEGVRQLVSGTFDVIVVGQGSRNFEGHCVLDFVVEFNRCLPLVVVARHLEMSCYLEAMQLGAVDYLAGPFSMEEMARVMRTCALRRQGGVKVERPTSGPIPEKLAP